MAFFECPDCGTKLPYAGKPHACKAGKSSGGHVRHEAKAVSRTTDARVAPSPPESKPTKRAARGTFDRNAYQREYMRKRRQKEK